MPIFEFKCMDCGEQFETLVLNPEDTVTCASCDGTNIEKQFSAFGISSEGSSEPTASEGTVSGCTSVGCGCGAGH